MKMYKKSELTLINGMLVSESGDIVFPGFDVVAQANELETRLQKAKYLAEQPSAVPAPSLDGFERVSEREVHVEFVANTPMLDMKVNEAMDLMGELDDVEAVQTANQMVRKFAELLKFVDNDYVIDAGCGIDAFDTPMLGDPLKLTKADVAVAIATVCGMDKDDLTTTQEE